CRSGGMADADDSKSSGATRAGSTPAFGTRPIAPRGYKNPLRDGLPGGSCHPGQGRGILLPDPVPRTTSAPPSGRLVWTTVPPRPATPAKIQHTPCPSGRLGGKHLGEIGSIPCPCDSP